MSFKEGQSIKLKFELFTLYHSANKAGKIKVSLKLLTVLHIQRYNSYDVATQLKASANRLLTLKEGAGSNIVARSNKIMSVLYF